MVLKLFTTFIVVAAILASPKHEAFTWSYRSSIYRVHWSKLALTDVMHLLSCHARASIHPIPLQLKNFYLKSKKRYPIVTSFVGIL